MRALSVFLAGLGVVPVGAVACAMAAPLGVIYELADNPVRLSQIKIPQQQAPATAPTTDDTKVITTTSAVDWIGAFTAAGITEASKRDDSASVVYDGKYKGMDVQVILGGCTGQDGCTTYDFYALFGKQPTVDQVFVNAFNKHHFARLIPYENGTFALWLGGDISDGVTVKYVKGITAMFVTSIDGAASYKVEP